MSYKRSIRSLPLLFSVLAGLASANISVTRADEPTTPTTQTSPGASSASPAANTTEHKHSATNIVTGTVDKLSPTTISIKVTREVFSKLRPNSKPKLHKVTQTQSYEIAETPPVKVVTDSAKPTRTTGSYSDVKVGDLVEVGTRQVSIKNADGTSKLHTQVTGIDVHKHAGTETSSRTTAKTSNN